MVIKTILHRASFTMLRAIENFKELVENIFCYKCYLYFHYKCIIAVCYFFLKMNSVDIIYYVL